MNYVDRLRTEIYSRMPNVDEGLIDLYTLLGLTLQFDVTNSDVHDAWAIWQNRTRPDHKSLVEFDELDEKTQELDSKYRDAILAAVDEVFTITF